MKITACTFGMGRRARWGLAATLIALPVLAQAHEADLHCAAVEQSVLDAGFGDTVSVTCAGGAATLTSDTYPDHPLMSGIVGTNEQIPVPAPGHAVPVALTPVLTDTPLTRDAALGVAVNGVPIYDYTGGGEMSIDDLSTHQPHDDTILNQQLDNCGGHAGRGDDYHYHAAPTCMIDEMANAGPDAIIGWGFDGFPIYSDLNPDGTPIAQGDLGVCNGQPDEVFGFRYHTSAEAPYIVQCLMGEVGDLDALPRVSPLRASDPSIRVEAGRPPQGGVENLVFTTNADGERRMTYSYGGSDYYISYIPSGTENCYRFETKTITNNGEVFEAVLCR